MNVPVTNDTPIQPPYEDPAFQDFLSQLGQMNGAAANPVIAQFGPEVIESGGAGGRAPRYDPPAAEPSGMTNPFSLDQFEGIENAIQNLIGEDVYNSLQQDGILMGFSLNLGPLGKVGVFLGFPGTGPGNLLPDFTKPPLVYLSRPQFFGSTGPFRDTMTTWQQGSGVEGGAGSANVIARDLPLVGNLLEWHNIRRSMDGGLLDNKPGVDPGTISLNAGFMVDGLDPVADTGIATVIDMFASPIQKALLAADAAFFGPTGEGVIAALGVEGFSRAITSALQFVTTAYVGPAFRFETTVFNDGLYLNVSGSWIKFLDGDFPVLEAPPPNVVLDLSAERSAFDQAVYPTDTFLENPEQFTQLTYDEAAEVLQTILDTGQTDPLTLYRIFETATADLEYVRELGPKNTIFANWSNPAMAYMSVLHETLVTRGYLEEGEYLYSLDQVAPMVADMRLTLSRDRFMMVMRGLSNPYGLSFGDPDLAAINAYRTALMDDPDREFPAFASLGWLDPADTQGVRNDLARSFVLPEEGIDGDFDLQSNGALAVPDVPIPVAGETPQPTQVTATGGPEGPAPQSDPSLQDLLDTLPTGNDLETRGTSSLPDLIASMDPDNRLSVRNPDLKALGDRLGVNLESSDWRNTVRAAYPQDIIPDTLQSAGATPANVAGVLDNPLTAMPTTLVLDDQSRVTTGGVRIFSDPDTGRATSAIRLDPRAEGGGYYMSYDDTGRISDTQPLTNAPSEILSRITLPAAGPEAAYAPVTPSRLDNLLANLQPGPASTAPPAGVASGSPQFTFDLPSPAGASGQTAAPSASPAFSLNDLRLDRLDRN